MYSFDDFEHALLAMDFPGGKKCVAAGVSGGPDSMAMLWLLSRFGEKHGIDIHAFTVDHALRLESADEAAQVGEWVEDWPCVMHKILRWEEEKPQSRILEEARAARYALLKNAMGECGCTSLFIAHHADDQAETFLIRLAKGSGLDGLSAMAFLHDAGDGVTIVRPLLDVEKQDLIALCRENGIPYVNDPTNENEVYLRPRLRAAKDVLEEEGLSSKRLAVTARRFARARRALESMAADLYQKAAIEQSPQGVLFNWTMLADSPEELILRVLLLAMEGLCADATGQGYGPRMERAENLLHRLLRDQNFKGATLGGCIFAKDAKRGTLWIGRET